MGRTKNVKVPTLYEVKGNKVVRKKESCPKCGEGIFLAEHRDRKTCGKCSYMVFKKK
ncbi:MAG: 30S ribosomal protein S27ae [Candidatus Thermoplasmatota archaeon]|jgi:small subunit ribosomal protein S27Ae|nr:30S ribosomal protein S27ae [Candidatus Thermoplasmatota archaeon]MDP7264438.1 30S ribosomal protein S27ae [Candidatus Thermoplasmatota archaeon]